MLREKLTEKQYGALSHLRRKTLPDLEYKLGQLPFLVVGSLVKVLPAKSRLTVKSGINIVKKMDYRRRDIFLTIDSEMEYRVRLHSCKKEPETVEWIETFFREGDVLYDVGANVGAYSLVAAKFFGGKVQVYAFEPSFLNFPQLCKNVMLNECQESVVPFQVALSDETAIDVFNYFNLFPGGAVHALGEAIDHNGDTFTPKSRQPVLTYRTDDFIKQFRILPPNHIKIDVDGTELAILKGMDETLNDRSLRSMLLEITHGREQEPEILDFLAQKGFRVSSQQGLNHILVRPD